LSSIGPSIGESISASIGEQVLPIFNARLQNSLVPSAAQGSATATYTRATTATIEDFEGLIKPCLSGEARFKGARRVENLVAASEDMENAAYGVSNNAVVDSATQVTFDDTNDGDVFQSVTIIDDGSGAGGRTFVFSVKIKRISGTVSSDAALQLLISGSAVTAAAVDIGDEVTTAAQRFSMSISTDAAGTTVIPRVRWDDAGVLEITEWQLEEVTGQVNQNPSEYVSVGVLSAPFHGANVDAVQNFLTLNANSVSSNIVTESQGAAIGASDSHADASGPFGYLAEGARTNVAIQNETLGDAAWGNTAAPIDDNAAVAPDGRTTADRLNMDATTDFHHIVDTTFTNTGDQNVALTAYIKDDGETHALLNLSTSTEDHIAAVFQLSGSGSVTATDVGTTSGTIVLTQIDALPNSWYRCHLVGSITEAAAINWHVGGAGGATPTFDSAGRVSYLAVAGEDLFAWGVQVEDNAAFASSYIGATTSSSVTRNADVLTYADAGNIANAAGTAFVELTTLWATSSGTVSVIDGTGIGQRILYRLDASTPTAILARDTAGNTATSATGSSAQDTIQKAVSTWGANLTTYWNGAAGTAQDYGGTITPSTMGIGCRSSGDQQWFGTIRTVKIFNKELNSNEVGAL